MMNTKRLCILVICICIITPLGVGFMLPQSTTQSWEYTTGTTSTITSSVRNSTSEYTGDYFGELNNTIWGTLPPNFGPESGYTETTTQTSTPSYESSNDTWTYDHIDTSLDYFRTRPVWIMRESSGAMTITHTATDGTTSTITGVYYVYYSSIGNLLIYSPYSYMSYVRIYIDDGSYTVEGDTGSSVTYSSLVFSTTTYRDLSAGIQFYAPTSSDRTFWQNGYKNYSVIMNLNIKKDTSITVADVLIERDTDGMVSATYGSDTIYVGNYDDIMLEIGAESVLIHGLTAGDINSSPWDRIVNSRELSVTRSVPFRYLKVTAYDSWTVTAYVYSAEIVVGTYSSTIDYTLNMSSYFPTMDGWAIRLSNGSTVATGATLTIAGVTLPIYSGGTVIYDDVQYTLTGMIISAVNANGEYYIHINDKVLEGTDSSQWTTITFGGDWASIGVSVSEVSGNLRDTYQWEAGFFALSLHDYVGIGLLAAALSFVLCALIGRRSGEKVFWLLVVSGCCAAVYAVLLLG